MVIDTHVHVWNPDTPETPWRKGWARFAPRHRLGVEELLAAMDTAGVDRATLIPPEWDRYGNQLVLAAAAAHPDRLAAAPSVPLRDPDAPRLLADWVRRPGFLGLRQVFLAGPRYSPLTDGTAEWLWRAADEAGLTMMVWLPGQLSALPAVVDRFPRIRFVIDHLNMAMDAGAAELDATLAELVALADRPHVAVKASALPAIAAGPAGPYPYPSAGDLVRRAVDAFGADRVFWGSDFARLPCDYRQAVTMVDHLGVDRDLLLGDAFARWAPWPAGPAWPEPVAHHDERTTPDG